MRYGKRRRQAALVFGDSAALAVAMILAIAVRSGEWPSTETIRSTAGVLVLLLPVWIVVGFLVGQYSLDVVRARSGAWQRAAKTAAFSVGSAAVIYYLLANERGTPKTLLAIQGLLSLGLVGGWRLLAQQLIGIVVPKTRVAFVGSEAAASDAARELKARPELGYTLIGVLSPADLAGRAAIPAASMPEVVVIGEEASLSSQERSILLSLLGQPIAFVGIATFYEETIARVPVGLIDDLWLLKSIDLRSKQPYLAVKRALDVAIAGLLLTLMAPLWMLVAVAVRLDSKGPALFRQERLGLLGRTFTLFKFRSMRIDGNDGSPALEGDPRVTWLGRWLRATRIDEVPQLLNVIRGEMSLIGPRPEQPNLVEELERAVPFYRERLVVRPGITGWDQVSGEYHSPSREDTYKKLQYDLYYIKHLSLALDVAVLARTVGVVLQRAGR